MKKENKLESRDKDEKVEGKEFVQSDVPKGSFQDKQQIIEPVEEQVKTPVQENPFNAKKVESKGSQLKQEQVAKVITGTGGSSSVESIASPSRAGLRTLSYSGNEGTILGNPSGTPVVGSPSRSDTRPGQKLDAVAKAIDYIASEQALQQFDGSKPLQDNPGEKVGFLGHPDNESARMQKTAEAVPGALLYSRSVDENIRDEVAYVEGQMIREEGIDANVDPTITYNPETGENISFDSVRGNYIPKTMRLGVTTDGKIASVTFDVDDGCIEKPADIVNRSSSAFIRSANMDEINRQNMEKKAGNELEKFWAPEVRAVQQPTPTIGYLTDDEITTGSEIWMAYRFVNKAHSYFFNKASKDGQLPYRSFKEMLTGLSRVFKKSSDYENIANFDAADYLNGAPSLMIALYDSISKYSKRGDLLTQPRSWKLHKQTADNNINPFRINPILSNYVTNRDVFSTIDRGYDPLLPTCISDNWRLSHVLDFRKLMNYTHATTFVVQLGGKGVTTAGTAFDDVYDNLHGSTPSDTATLKNYASGVTQQEIYEYLDYTKSLNYGNPTIIFGTDKTGIENYSDAFEAGINKLYEFSNKACNNQLKPVVVLFKEKVPGGVDKVYAIVRYPGVINVTTAANVQLFIKHSTTTDYMSSDVSKDTIIVDSFKELDVTHFSYKYQNRATPYIVTVKNPLLYGILDWAKDHAIKLRDPQHTSGTSAASTYADAQGIIWYNIPIVHSSTNISLWDLIVCASIKYMQKVRTNSQLGTLNYESNIGQYPFEQLDSIANQNPLASVNYSMTDILQPLHVGTMKPATALSWIMPVKFWRVSHTMSGSDITGETFVFPFYWSEDAVKLKPSSQSGISVNAVMEEDGYVFNYPTTRAGVRLGYLDDFYGMSERDIRLCLDMMTDIPGRGLTATGGPKIQGVYKYGLSNSGIPVISYDNTHQPLNVEAYIKTPLEIGLGFVAPLGYNAVPSSFYLSSGKATIANYAEFADLLSLGTSYRIRTWKVHDGVYRGIHDPKQLIVTRGGNFAQDWAIQQDSIYGYTDNQTGIGYNHSLTTKVDIGVAISFNDAMEVTDAAIVGEAGNSLFKPFNYSDNVEISGLPNILTLQKILWTKLQVLPYALSPFDQTPECRLVSGSVIVVNMTADPYDLLYIFGFAGFKASDFREDVYDRIYEKINLGWTYTKDPFVEASPVLK